MRPTPLGGRIGGFGGWYAPPPPPKILRYFPPYWAWPNVACTGLLNKEQSRAAHHCVIADAIVFEFLIQQQFTDRRNENKTLWMICLLDWFVNRCRTKPSAVIAQVL